MKRKGVIFVLLSAILYGFTPILCSLTYEMGNNPISLTFFRALFSLPVLYLIIRYTKQDLKVTPTQFRDLASVGIIGMFCTTLLLYTSYNYLGVGSATTLHFLYPIFVALLCKFAYHDHLGREKIIPLILAFLGTLCFFNFNESNSLIGVLIAISSGITYSIYMVLSEKRKIAQIGGFKTSFYVAGFMLLGASIYGMVTKSLVFNLPFITYVLMFIISMLTSFLAVYLLLEGIKYLGSSQAALLSLLEPITSVICGALILHETVSINKVVGCLIIIVAVGLLVLLKPQQNK